MNEKMKVVAITDDHKVEVKEVRRPDVKPGNSGLRKMLFLSSW